MVVRIHARKVRLLARNLSFRLHRNPNEPCRRVAAATGNPPSVNDDIIEIDLPSDSPGFGPSSPMHTNIKIGRVTGRILSGKICLECKSPLRVLTSVSALQVLYGKELHSEDVLIPHVQKIIQDLYDISKEIPSDLDAANSSSSANLPLRTNISLQLMLYQVCLPKGSEGRRRDCPCF